MRRLLALLACTVAVTACGDSTAQSPPTVVLSLDFVPNAVHAPIYMAVRDGHARLILRRETVDDLLSLEVTSA